MSLNDNTIFVNNVTSRHFRIALYGQVIHGRRLLLHTSSVLSIGTLSSRASYILRLLKAFFRTIRRNVERSFTDADTDSDIHIDRQTDRQTYANWHVSTWRTIRSNLVQSDLKRQNPGRASSQQEEQQDE